MISEQDMDQLSAYLDHQLSASDQSALEARLLKEPELKAALRDLRLQVRAMRDLPKVKAPRNFTLTAKQAEAIRPARRSWFSNLFPALRLATALSAFAFVAVIATSLLQPPVPQTASLPAQSDQFLREATGSVANSAPESTGTVEANIGALAAPMETQVSDGTPAPPAEVEVQQYAEPESATAASAPPAEDRALIQADPSPLQLAAIGFGALTLVLAVVTWLARR
jgi:hypothetical protein